MKEPPLIPPKGGNLRVQPSPFGGVGGGCHFNITVIGKVQGVFYRQSTIEIAKQLAIKGFVCNKANGNVYIEAEGEEEQLNKLIEWCKVGPPGANVADMKFTEGEMKNFSVFKIRR